MDVVQLVEKVTQYEDDSDISNISYNGFSLLPFLRYEALLAFRNGSRYQSQRIIQPKTSRLGKLKARLSSRPLTNQFTTTEILFYDPHFKSVDLNGKLYNQLLDPFIECFEQRGHKVGKTSLIWKDSHPNGGQSYPIIPVYKDIWFARYLSEADTDLATSNLIGVIKNWNAAIGVDVNMSHLLNALQRADFARFVFKKLLKETNVKRVFFECYYKPEVLGLIASCRELGIATVDLQHGKQGTHHLMYTHWRNTPKNGFNVLPNEFWNWGDESKSNIVDNAAKSFIQSHEPKSIGFPWIDKCIESIPFNLNSEANVFLSHVKKYDRVVLITLQPDTVDEDGLLPNRLLNAISNSDNKCAWLIRLHPTMDSLGESYASLLSMTNVFIKHPSKLPLYALLKISTHHITKFSSVSFEASAFGVPTLIIGDIGKKLYSKQFDTSVFFHESALSFAAFINETPNFKLTSYFKTFEPDDVI